MTYNFDQIQAAAQRLLALLSDRYQAVMAFEATARKRWEHRGSLAIGGIAFP